MTNQHGNSNTIVNSKFAEIVSDFLHLAANKETNRLPVLLNGFCNVIVQHSLPDITAVSVKFADEVFTSNGFQETSHRFFHEFETPDNTNVLVEVFFNEALDVDLIEQRFGVKKLLLHLSMLFNGAISAGRLKKLKHHHTEREKELAGINRANEILSKGIPVYSALKEICDQLPEAWQYPEHTVVRIKYNGQVFTSKSFTETQWVQQQSFEAPDGKSGSIEVFYLKQFPEADEGPFLKEERNFLSNLAGLISGSVSRNALEELLKQNTERLKELGGINNTSAILKRTRHLEDALPKICAVLPAAFQYPEHTRVRIKYNRTRHESDDFMETPWRIVQNFKSVSNKRGTIEVFYTQAFPELDHGPFLKEERHLLINLANLIAGQAAKDVFGKIQRMNIERLKELNAINQTSKIIEEGNNVHETLQRICDILPNSWQYPQHTACRIKFENHTYTSENFMETDWVQQESIFTIDNKKGIIEIFYLKEFPREQEGPFLTEERNLLINISKLVSGCLNSYKGFEIINSRGVQVTDHHKSDEFRKSLVKNRKPLQLYFNQQSIDKYVYLDMMRYKVKHILFVSTLYDAFMLESEDTFFEKFMGEIYQYSLFSLPRITGVSSEEEALDLLETTRFDIVVLMGGRDRKAPIELSEKIKKRNEDIPIYLLINKKSDVKYFEDLIPTIRSINKLYVWNGDSLIFFAIVKTLEDRINVENDTKVGLVRVILLIEDSPLYYSKYLQHLYSIVFDQVQKILPEVEKNELDKICKMRSRPKVLLARNYEEAISIFNKYKDFMLCVISDVEFDRAGKADKQAGLKFIEYARRSVQNLPVVLQSSDDENARWAKQLDVTFINKNSETLMNDLKSFLNSHLGFGHFIFRDKKGNKIAVARSIREFETHLQKIPDESFLLHANENQFSLWLMARGEIELAKTVNPLQVHDIGNVKAAREIFLDAIQKYKEEKKRGKIMSFDETATLDEKNIVSFSGGSLGGKGRGLAFINVLIYNLDFSALSSRINILTPITVIIGTDEFQSFITRNKLTEKILDPEISYAELREYFYNASLSNALIRKLKIFVNQIDKPISVRSSSTSEDSITQPFSGVFDTYIIPNSPTSKKRVVELLANAIKLVYASVYSDDARVYFDAIHHRVEDEKMAVILQELVGSYHNEYYYPHISGVAQSYNYYPIAAMKPEEGFAVIAVGLGSYVVNGWKSYRFSPSYPKVSVYGTKELLNSTQVKFYALKCEDLTLDLLKDGELASLEMLDIDVAESHGTLTHCASVYNMDNDRIKPGLSSAGPRIINFANILQYDHIPLSETINTILHSVEEAFGSPVEIEFAVDLSYGKNNLPTFYLLQIKPLVTGLSTKSVDVEKFSPDEMVLFTRSSLGNGQIDSMTDVIYVDPQLFNKLETIEMVAEIEKLNRQMNRQKRKYILIGPGRWGTRDPFLGIPVNWSQISGASVIVETSLDNFPFDSSLGSHFFHNVTSMNIGYFSVPHNSDVEFIRWNTLEKQELINKTKYFRHVRFEKPLCVIMDGRKRTSAILVSDSDSIG
ncbi:MAG: hypothetical protein KKE62_15730 [Proteobacteria bacterium]|nr:hypothetical protein [Pseudomonadota bacterium]MBU1387298.1 hypothetical protein [Pseudomonadota bacterium]MBU1544280.1 hypothetical protein [Pseudomonadota bacterium]MBU2482994.1 hypothetical protein [Pseudomonadota bacterium]